MAYHARSPKSKVQSPKSKVQGPKSGIQPNSVYFVPDVLKLDAMGKVRVELRTLDFGPWTLDFVDIGLWTRRTLDIGHRSA